MNNVHMDMMDLTQLQPYVWVLMSVHFQHVVEYTTGGHGSKYVKP